MLLYKIINNISDGTSAKKVERGPSKIVRELRKVDEAYNRAVLLKERERQNASRKFD